MTASSATLYIVATPIGNLGDLSPRARTILQTVDVILAEDTRHSKALLHAFGIQTPLQSFHAHNETQKSVSVLEALKKGTSFALISDAGTPLISDPGFPLVQKAQALGLTVIPIPGPCALIAALSAAGMPCDTFTFAGFLPAKSSARRDKLLQLKQHQHTLIFYESTHRIDDSLNDIATIYGENHEMVLAKELTKTFESIKRGTAREILCWLEKDRARTKGEFVLILAPQQQNEPQQDELLSILLAELPLKQAVSLAAKISKKPKNTLYQQALAQQR